MFKIITNSYIFYYLQIETLKQERAHTLETKARLIRMKIDLDNFTSTLKRAKKSEYEVGEL